MISSEVQRTLVKSPPELWTELSDPEALARHLAELGEIKITRIEPEQLVEWEADRTTGAVAIKASGWGTKVTLTVNRELPEPEASEAEVSAEAPEEAPAQILEEAPEQTAAPTAEAAPEDGAVAEPPEAMPIEPTPAPATEAARRAMGWPAAHTDAGPAVESDLRAAEAAEQAPDEMPPAAPEAAGQEVPEDPSDPLDQPQPRRGFFARLFGRRRRADGAPAPEPAQQAEPDLTESSLPQSDVEPAPSEAPEIEAGNLDEDAPDAAPVVEDAPELQPEPVAHALQHDPTLDREGETAAAAEPAAAEPVEQDLAAELKAAEETAAEEVKAVLTGVLDRLGAAHHRPFSRA